MAGNLWELLEERDEEGKRCGAGCLHCMLCVRSTEAGGITLEVEYRQAVLLE
jgi:hypothetical protein